MNTSPTLHPFQRAAKDAVLSAVPKGQNRILLQMPTGTGKTVTFASLIFDPRMVQLRTAWGAQGAHTLVIAHREELLEQAREKIAAACPGAIVAIEQGDRYAPRASDVVVASIQSLSAVGCRRLEALQRAHTFRLVVVDEAHHAAASSYRAVLARLGFLPASEQAGGGNAESVSEEEAGALGRRLAAWDREAPRDRLLLGVTATPNRADAVGLSCVFQTIAFSYRLRQAIDDGWLVPMRPWIVETDASLDDVRVVRGEFVQKDLAATVNTSSRNDLAVASWATYASGRPTIAFTVDVQHATDLAAAFARAGVTAAAISGDTPKEVRRATLQRFRDGQVTVLCNCMVLTEGTDLPVTSCILHAKPTKSATLYEQMTGRGLRLSPGKADCVVIDLVDVARRHSLLTAGALFGLPPKLNPNGHTLGDLANEIDALREQYAGFDLDGAIGDRPKTLAELRARAVEFDVWSVPALPAALAGLLVYDWIQLSEDTYRLQYPWSDGTESITVKQDLIGQWEIVAALRPHVPAGSVPVVRQRTVGEHVPSAPEALALAEVFVKAERPSVHRLKGKDAKWKQDQATEKQIALLRRRRIPFAANITKGQASQLLDLHSARRG